MSNQFLDAAIEYASKGMAVFPIKPRELAQITIFGTEQKYPTERKQRWVKHL